MVSNLYKSDPAVISHIFYMIEEGNFGHQKTFEVVLADLQRNHDKEIHKQENETAENKKTHEEMDEKEVIDLCSESQTTMSEHWKGKRVRNEKIMTWREQNNPKVGEQKQA